MKQFITNCVHSTEKLISSMVDACKDITREQFLAEVDQEEHEQMEVNLGYNKKWLEMKDDYHVSYHRSTYDGNPCVYFCHSRIEYIYV